MFKLATFRNNLIAGVLVLAPIGAVFGIVVWIWDKLMGLSRIVPYQYSPRFLFGLNNLYAIRFIDFLTTVVMLAVILLILAAVGLVSRNYFGKKLLERIARFVSRVPVLSAVYSTLEQLLKTFASGQAKNFRRVVQLEYPRKGLYTLAFVTGERDKLLTVYVPTTPNPTSGFYLMVAPDEVRDAGMTVEDALKEIISMGIVHKGG
ncbi:MAG: DUF502 domain-containing protein [Deltaproteobacteria bacterium]|nr:DUF502 domain-containing protein [Deltaproteobacteria bacterium]